MDNNRHPSPPPDSEPSASGDVIGSTTYSERFVLKTLMALLKESQQLSNKNEEIVVELEEDFESRMCILWDMSTDEEIVEYLCDHDAVDIFAETLKSTNKPRLWEILMGLVANIVCCEKGRERLKGHQKLKVFRLCVMNEMVTDTWIETFDSLDIWEDILFIAASNTNEVLMSETSQCLDVLLENVQFAESYSKRSQPVKTLIEIIDSRLDEKRWVFCSFLWHCVQTLTTYEFCEIHFASETGEIFEAIKRSLNMLSKSVSTEDLDICESSSTTTIICACCYSILNWMIACLNFTFLNDKEVDFLKLTETLETFLRGIEKEETPKSEHLELAKAQIRKFVKLIAEHSVVCESVNG